MDETKKEKQQIEKPLKVKSPEKVKVTFKENRKYDLHIARQVITFKGRVTIDLPKEMVELPEFKQVESLFTVKRSK